MSVDSKRRVDGGRRPEYYREATTRWPLRMRSEARHLSKHRAERLALPIGEAAHAVLTRELLAAQSRTRLKANGLGWINFQVMRRTHSGLMWDLHVDPKVTADQLGHSVDVNQNVYTQANLKRRLEAVNRLENACLAADAA